MLAFRPISSVCLIGLQAFWDCEDQTTFAITNGSVLNIYIFVPLSIHGQHVKYVGEYILKGFPAANTTSAAPLGISHLASYFISGREEYPDTHVPVILRNGLMWCHVCNGALDSIVLSTHSDLVHIQSPVQIRESTIKQAIALHRLNEAWEFALTLKNQTLIQEIGKLRHISAFGMICTVYKLFASKNHANLLNPCCVIVLDKGEVVLECLDIELGMEVFRYLKDASTVINLQKIRQYDDKNLIAGSLLVLLGKDINKGQVRASKFWFPTSHLTFDAAIIEAHPMLHNCVGRTIEELSSSSSAKYAARS